LAREGKSEVREKEGRGGKINKESLLD